MSEKLKLKSIYELLCNEEGKAERFFIPSYQRGYRWTKRQVEELLEDIWEFTSKEKKKGEFYCLQPVVVKKNKDNSLIWDVLDGQQRLTTIYIILKFLESKFDIKGRIYINEFYTINYATRAQSGDFLNNLPNTENENEYIDFFHMKKAYEIIENWFYKNKIDSIDFSTPILKHKLEEKDGIKKDIENNIRVIWYEVEDSIDVKHDIDIFTRINMGKIPLTNAELIKALLIQGYGNNDNKDIKDNKQFELASEWDFIEYSLQNDDFWYFINKDKNEKATRIEFIFELIAEKYFNENQEELKELRNSKSIDKYYEFHIINHYLQNDNRSNEKNELAIYEKLWNEVKNYFRILNEWYEDREFFHKIGFLAIYSDKTILNFIDSYMEISKTKQNFRIFLDEQIKSVFKNKNEFIDIESLKYDDKNDIRKVLLWFNISTIIKNDKSNLRFQFDRYKTQSWDIEHIRSQTDKYPNKQEEKEAWLKDIISISKKNNQMIMEEYKKDFNALFNEIQKEIEGDDKFEKDDIGNLTLLDSKTNRGYGNAFFPIKRKTIIENDMKGTFIPICTKNLFLKYYSEKTTDLQKWTKQDAESYKNAILKTFEEIFKNEVKNGK